MNLKERRKGMRYVTVLFIAVTMLFAVPSYAHIGGRVEIEVLADRGGSLTTIPFKDYKEGKTHIIKRYLEARKGENYSIVIRNKTPERVGVVLAVDGRNIISGRKSSLKNSERMYVLDPYGSARLDGWRTDEDTVHSFYFAEMKDSYAVRTFGDASAMGVIAAAMFREKGRPVFYEQNIKKEKAPEPSSGRSAESSAKTYDSARPGTGFGDARYSPVIKVEFEPESSPYEKVLVKYEWRQVLCRKGLLQCPPEGRARLWDEDEYAPCPPGYQRR